MNNPAGFWIIHARRLQRFGKWISYATSCLGLLAASAQTSRAATIAWTNTAGGSWSARTNWSGGQVPGVGDDVIISTNGTYSVAVDGSVAFASLTLGGGKGIQTIQWTAGTMSGLLTISDHGVLNLAGDSAKAYTGGVITNYGQIVWLPGGPSSFSLSGARLENQPSGVIDMQMDGRFVGDGGASMIDNQGTLRKSGGVGIGGFSQDLVLNNNIGFVDVQSGTMQFPDGFTSSGTFSVAAKATIQLLNGTFNLGPGHTFVGDGFYGVSEGSPVINGPIVNTNFMVTGGQLNISNTLTGVLNWKGGNVSGALTVQPGGMINLVSTNAKVLTAIVITNRGQILWPSNGPPSLSFNAGQIQNEPGGVIDMGMDGWFVSTGGNNSVNNSGLLRKSGGTGVGGFTKGVGLSNLTVVLSTTGIPYTYIGLVDAQSGTMQFQDGFTSSGVMKVAAGAVLQLQNGVFTLNPGHMFSGDGFYGVSDGSPVINGPITDPSFMLTGGQMNITNQLIGVLNWVGGTVSGTLNVAASGVLNLGGTNAKVFMGGVLTNYGAILWPTNGPASLGLNGARIVNQAGGLIDLQMDGSLLSIAPPASLHNAGTLRKSGGTGTSTIGVPFVNTGFIQALTGTLAFSDTFDMTGGGLTFGIGGLSNIGQIKTAGSVPLVGSIGAELLNGFKPSAGATFTVMTFAASSGSFSDKAALRVGPETVFEPLYGSSGLALRWRPVTPQLAAGTDHAVLLKPDGTIWTWGGIASGQLGYTNFGNLAAGTFTTVPRQVGTDADWVYVAAGSGCSFGIKDDGSLWGWGATGYEGANNGRFATPTRLGTDTNWVKVVPLSGAGYAIKKDGSLWGWGGVLLGDGHYQTDSFGRVAGLPLETNRFFRPGPPGVWASVSSYSRTTWAATSSGQLYAWGDNTFGQLCAGVSLRDWTEWNTVPVYRPTVEIGGYTNSPIPIADGGWRTVVPFGSATDNNVQPGFMLVTLALATDGTFATNTIPLLPLGRTLISTTVDSCAERTKPDPKDPTKTIPILSSLDDSSYRTTGSVAVVSVGSPATGSSIIEFEMESETCVYADGVKEAALTVTTTNSLDPLEFPYSILVPANLGSGCFDLKNNAGRNLALVGDGSRGTIWVQGDNYRGSFGTGLDLETNTFSFAQVGSDNDWVAIAAGGDFNLALKADGGLWGWGWHRYDTNLLHPTNYSSLVPVRMFPLDALVPPASIAGRVTSTNGAAIPGATVTLSPDGLVAFTDAAGQYQFPAVPAGNHTLTAQAGDLSALAPPLKVVGGETLFRDLVLRHLGHLAGRVFDKATDGPIAGASVTAGGQAAVSGTDGTYALTLDAGIYTVTATATNYQPASLAVTVSNGATNTADFGLEPKCDSARGSTLQGIVYDEGSPNGDPVVGATVTLIAAGATGGDSATTGPDGSFRISPVTPGMYLITVDSPTYESFIENVRIGCGQDVVENLGLLKNLERVSIRSVTTTYGPQAFFLHGINFAVRTTVIVNWEGHPPGVVRFYERNSKGQSALTREVKADNGPIVETYFDMGSTFAPGSTLVVVAESADYLTRRPELCRSLEFPAQLGFMDSPIPASYGVTFHADTSHGLTYTNDQPFSINVFSGHGLDENAIPWYVPFFANRVLGLLLNPGANCTIATSGHAVITASNPQDTPGLLPVGIGVDLGGIQTRPRKDTDFFYAGGEQNKWEFALMGGRQHDRQNWGAWENFRIHLGAGGSVESQAIIPLPLFLGLVQSFAYGKLGSQAVTDAVISDLDPLTLDDALSVMIDIKGLQGIGVGPLVPTWASIHGSLEGKAQTTFQLPADQPVKGFAADITAEAGVSILGLAVNLTLPPIHFSLGSPQAATLASLQALSDAKWRLLERETPAAQASGLQGRRSLLGAASGFQSAGATLSDYQLPGPTVTMAGTNAMLVWLEDNTSRSTLNRSVAVFSQYDGTNWTTPGAMSDDGKADFQVTDRGFPDGSALAAWTHANKVLSDQAQLDEVAGAMEIRAALYDPSAGRWVSVATLTTNSYADFNPRLAGPSRNNAMLAWIARPDNHLFPTNGGSFELWFSTWNGAAWSQAAKIAEIPYSILGFDLAYDGTTAQLVAAANLGQPTNSTASVQLFASTYSAGNWSPLAQSTAGPTGNFNPHLVIDDQGSFVLFWLRGDQLCRTANLAFGNSVVLRDGAGTAGMHGFSLANGPAGRLAAVWMGPSSHYGDLFGMFYDPTTQKWGSPKQLTSDPELKSPLTPCWMGTNQLLAVYQSGPPPTTNLLSATVSEPLSVISPVSGTGNLKAAAYTLRNDPALLPGSLVAAEPSPLPGQQTTLYVTALNAGDFGIHDAMVTFFLGDPANQSVIGTVSTTNSLDPGQAAVLSLDWTVPPATNSLLVTAVIDAAQALSDANRTNNRTTLTLLQPNLEVEALSWQSRGSNAIIVNVSVANLGGLASAASSLSLSPASGTNQLASPQTIPSLQPSQVSEFSFTVDTRALPMDFAVAASINQDVSPQTATPFGRGVLAVARSTVAIPTADLQITVQAPASLSPGQLLTATGTITNAGDVTAADITFRMPIPTNANLVSFTNSTGVFQVTNQFLVGTIDSLPAHASVAFAVVLSPTGLGAISNSFSAAFGGYDPNLTNNTVVTITSIGLPQPPVVTLIKPAPGEVIFTGQPYTLIATATSPQGSIREVDFLRNGVNIASVTNPPYQASVVFDFPGPLQIQAAAYDNQGLYGASSNVSVMVQRSPPLTAVLITSPTNGASFGAPASVEIDVQTQGDPNAFPSVQLFGNSNSLAFFFPPQPLIYRWTNLAAGNYALSAVASAGGIILTSAPVTFSVTNTPIVPAAGWKLDTWPLPAGGQASGLNNLGQIVGYTYGAGQTHAARWSAAEGMVQLPVTNALPSSYATAINDGGQVAGFFAGGFGTNLAYVWSAGSGVTVLGTLGGSSSQANAINAAGQVAGTSTDGSQFGINRAFLWSPSTGLKNLGGTGLFDPPMWGLALDSAGRVVGYESVGINWGGFLRDTNGVVKTIGALPGDSASQATAINDAGQVLGDSYGGTKGSRPFLWTAQGGLTPLPILAAFTNGLNTSVSTKALNQAGVAVGLARTADGQQQAWVYAAGAMTNLNDLLPTGSIVLNDAVAINNAGQIAGNATWLGAPVIYLLTPPPTGGTPTAGIWLDPRSLQLGLDGTFRFTIQVTNVSRVVIQASTNLTGWFDLGTNAVSQNSFSFQDLLPAKPSQRYYRAKAIP